MRPLRESTKTTGFLGVLEDHASSMLVSEIAHAYSFLTRCKNSVEKRGFDPRVDTWLQRHSCDPICQHAAPFVASRNNSHDIEYDLFGICRDFRLVNAYASHVTAARPL